MTWLTMNLHQHINWHKFDVHFFGLNMLYSRISSPVTTILFHKYHINISTMSYVICSDYMYISQRHHGEVEGRQLRKTAAKQETAVKTTSTNQQTGNFCGNRTFYSCLCLCSTKMQIFWTTPWERFLPCLCWQNQLLYIILSLPWPSGFMP